jgi:asparagine synthase (glutamine-hydrolysing)
MCGIAGFAKLDNSNVSKATRLTLESMARALRPRGPDDMQFVELGPASLSFTRLSLLDPEHGRQPFASRDGLVTLAANGEIYNHPELRRKFDESLFHSHSDCEVLLHLYERDGLDFLESVRGMFGIAIIDLREQRVVLARDRIGLKPMFIHRTSDSLLFASEIKALFQHPDCPRVLDWSAGLANQGFNAAPIMPSGEPANWFRGVRQIEPGTIVTYDLRNGDTSTKVYWRRPAPLAPGDVSPEELTDQVRLLLSESVQECLVADADVGLLLSGGVDSASIAALAKGTAGHSFTALSAATLLNGDADYARSTAATLGFTHHELAFANDAVPSPEDWRRLLWLMESPLCGPEQYYKSEIYRFARQGWPGMKAMLLGSGADELSGGYSRMLAGGGDWHDFIGNLTQLSRRRALAARAPALEVWWQARRPLVRDDLIRVAFPGALGDVYEEFEAWKIRDWLQYNFWLEDRAASGNSIEARFPYLDHRIVEVLSSVPRKYREELFWDKRIIRSAAADLLPSETTSRPKIAFFDGDGARYTHVTFARMLAANSYELLEQALASPSAAQFLNGDQMRACVADIIDGTSDTHVELLLRLVNMGLLDQAAQTPPTTQPSSAPPVPEVSQPTDRSQRRAILFGESTVTPDSVVRLGDGVLLLDGTDGQSFISADGQLRFVIDHGTDFTWLSVLRGVDGEKDVRTLCADAGCELESVAEFIDQSILEGLLIRAGETR